MSWIGDSLAMGGSLLKNREQPRITIRFLAQATNWKGSDVLDQQ